MTHRNKRSEDRRTTNIRYRRAPKQVKTNVPVQVNPFTDTNLLVPASSAADGSAPQGAIHDEEATGAIQASQFGSWSRHRTRASSALAEVPLQLRLSEAPRPKGSLSIDHGRWRTFLWCQQRFDWLYRQHKTEELSPEQVLRRVQGKAIERIAATPAGEKRARVAQAQEKSLPAQPARERHKTLQQNRKAVAVHDRMLGDLPTIQNRQFYFLDNSTKRILCAKPDIIQYRRNDDGSWSVLVIDTKHSFDTASRDESQLWFFGAVVKLILDAQVAEAALKGEKAESFEIELVVRLTAAKVRDGKRDNIVEQEEGQLGAHVGKIRRVIKELDTAFATNEFTARLTSECDTSKCPFRSACSLYQKMQTDRNADLRILVTPTEEARKSCISNSQRISAASRRAESTTA